MPSFFLCYDDIVVIPFDRFTGIVLKNALGMAVNVPFNVSIVGHSFVRRMATYVSYEHNYRSANLDLDESQYHVTFIARGVDSSPVIPALGGNSARESRCCFSRNWNQ